MLADDWIALCRRVASGGQGGQCPPDFRLCPPDLFLAPPTVFFWEEEVAFFGRKNVEICDFRQKKPSDFGEDLFFLEITCFWLEKNVKISARKSLRKSAKTFAPPILILPPPPDLAKLATPLALWLHLCLTFGFAFSIWLCSGWLRLVGSLLLTCSKSNKAKNHSYSGAGNPPISTNQNTAK